MLDKPSDQALATINMSRLLYNEICEPLLNAGFESKHLEQLICRPAYKLPLAAVRQNYEKLLKAPYCLKHEQIINMAIQPGGGSLNINAFIEFFEDLRSLNFEIDQIVSIVANSGGSGKLRAISDFKTFSHLGLTPNDIIDIVKYNGGALSLTALQESFPQLREMGLSLNQIKKIACRKGSAHEIKSALMHFKTLIAQGNDANLIVAWLSQEYAYRYINQCAEKSVPLSRTLQRRAIPIQTNVSKENKPLAVISSTLPLDESLNSASASSSTLLNDNRLTPLPLLFFGQSNFSSFITVPQRSNISVSLNRSEQCYSTEQLTFLFLGFTSEQADQLIFKQSLDSQTAAKLLERPYQLNPNQISIIALGDNGSTNIQAVEKYFPPLIAYGYTEDQIINMLLSDDGAYMLSYISNVIATDLIIEQSSTSLVTPYVSNGLFSMQNRELTNLSDNNDDLDIDAYVSKRSRYE